MMTALSIACISGLILGLYGRASVIVVTSIIVLCLSVPFAILGEWGLGSAVLITFGVLAVLQFGFLVGLYASTNANRVRKSLRRFTLQFPAKSELPQTNPVD